MRPVSPSDFHSMAPAPATLLPLISRAPPSNVISIGHSAPCPPNMQWSSPTVSSSPSLTPLTVLRHASQSPHSAHLRNSHSAFYPPSWTFLGRGHHPVVATCHLARLLPPYTDAIVVPGPAPRVATALSRPPAPGLSACLLWSGRGLLLTYLGLRYSRIVRNLRSI